MKLYVLDYITFCGNEREISMYAYTRIQSWLDKSTKNHQKAWQTEIQAVIVDETKFNTPEQAEKYAATKIGEQLKTMFVDNGNINLPISALAFKLAVMEFEDEMAWLGSYSNNCRGYRLNELFTK